MKSLVIILLASLALTSTASHAELAKKSVLSLQASQEAVAGNYQKAIGIYSQLIRMDPKDADHYIQRGLLYRQIKNTGRSMGDGAMALKLANYNLKKRSTGKRGAKHYRQRAQAYRLLQKFQPAEADMRRAMRLRGDQRYLPDLQAIVLEAKIYKSGQ